MKIAILDTKETPRARYLMSCFRRGAATHGDICIWVQGAENLHLLDDVDVGIQVCMVNQHRSREPINEFRVSAWERMRALNKRMLVLDTGFVKNQYDYYSLQQQNRLLHPRFHEGDPTTFENVDRRIYYELAYEGIKGFGDHCAGQITADRWAKLGYHIKPWRRDGDYILILTQPLHGQSSQNVNIFDWYATTLVQLRKYTRLPFVGRLHPRVSKFKEVGKHTNNYKSEMDKRLPRNCKVRWSTNVGIEQDLANARLALAYSTNAAVTAVLEGVPVHVGSPNCMAHDVSQRDLRIAVTQQCKLLRNSWLYRLAYSQWNCQELSDGSAWAHYRPHATLPRKDL